MNGLDKFVEQTFSNPNDSSAIRFPECPRCKQQIRRCTRYMPIINRVNNLIAKVKTRILGNQSEEDIDEKRKHLMRDFEKAQSDLKEVNLIYLKRTLDTLQNRENFLPDDLLRLMQNSLVFLYDIDKILIDGRKQLPVNVFDDLVSDFDIQSIMKFY